MPKRPSGSGFSLSIDDDFDETRSYRVKLYDLSEGPSTWPGAKADDMSITWKLNIYREDGTAFENPNTGEVFDCWAFSSDSTFKTSRGRGYVEAFMGGEMTDEQVDALIDNGFANGLVGKTALASFEIQTTADGNERLKVALLRPDRPTRRTAAPARPAVEAEPEPAAAPRSRRLIDD